MAKIGAKYNFETKGKKCKNVIDEVHLGFEPRPLEHSVSESSVLTN